MGGSTERGVGGTFPSWPRGRGPAGNLVYRKAARFQPDGGPAGRIAIAEVEELVPTGALDPECIHTPGVFVNRIVVARREKRIERRTVRKG